MPQQIGFGQTYEEYIQDLVAIFREVYRATRKSGTLWLILDTFKAHGTLKLLPFELANRLNKDIGWNLEDVIIWDKEKTLPWSRRGQLRNQFEYILCFSKEKQFKYYIDRLKEIDLKEWWVKYPERYNPTGKVPANIWRLPIPVQGSWSSNGLRHACPFPASLVERILLLTTSENENELVLDPFAGSGIVLALAEQMGRGFLGFELNPEFISMYRKVVRKAVKKQWTVQKAHLTTLEDSRKALQEKILRLRLNKYPKVLIRELQSVLNEEKSAVLGVIGVAPILPPATSAQDKRHHLTSLHVFVVVDQATDLDKINNAILRVTQRAPLSKFGINAEVMALRPEDALVPYKTTPVQPNDMLWIYKRGRTERFHCTAILGKWLEEIRLERFSLQIGSSFPPIASNVSVSERASRTWFPRGK